MNKLYPAGLRDDLHLNVWIDNATNHTSLPQSHVTPGSLWTRSGPGRQEEWNFPVYGQWRAAQGQLCSLCASWIGTHRPEWCPPSQGLAQEQVFDFLFKQDIKRKVTQLIN